MEHINLSYLLFYASLFVFKVFIILVFILITLFLVNSIFNKSKKSNAFNVQIVDLNDKLVKITDNIKKSILNKKDYKLYKKQEKILSKRKNILYEKNNKYYVINFKGDVKVSNITQLRNAITIALEVMDKNDEIIITIESPGGMVSNYGLAASQLERIKNKNIKLTVLVDLVAASGGYLMACVADKIIAAPFAVVGSIGVVAQMPNINRFLEKHDIDIEQHTSGKFKRTLTTLGKNNEQGREKFKDDLKRIHDLFKTFVKKYRPNINIEKTSTGEHWYSLQAIDLNLIDEIKTSDEFLTEKSKEHKIYEIKIAKNNGIRGKLQIYARDIIYNMYYKLVNKIL